jgi:hypothetical protein
MAKKKTDRQDSWSVADVVRRAQMLSKVLPKKSMEEAKLKNLLDVANEQDQVKIKVLYNVVIKGVNEYNKNSSQTKLKNWRAAEKELDAHIDKLWVKYIDRERTFPNLLAVIKYLKEQNWKIEKSRAYFDRKEGKIKPQKNGTYPLSDIEKYAAEHLTLADGSKPGAALEKIQSEKAQFELDMAEQKLKHLRFRNDLASGMYVFKESFEQELTKRAAFLKSDIENFIRAFAEKTVALVGGDPAKAPLLIDFQTDAAAGWLDRYSSDKEFTVPAPAAMAMVMDDKDFTEHEED